MIHQPNPVDPHGHQRPGQSRHEDARRLPGPEAHYPQPGVDVPAPRNKTKPTVEWRELIELFPQPDMASTVQQVIEEIARHQPPTDPPPARIVRAGHKKAREGKIPRMFHEKI